MSSSSDDELARAGKVTREDSGDLGVQVGQWYWMECTVNETVFLDKPELRPEAAEQRKRRPSRELYRDDFKHKVDKDITARRLLCVTHIGSNYVKLQGSPYDGSYGERWCSWRVHMNEFAAKCTFEPNGAALAKGYAQHHRQNAAALMAQVQEEMERLGVVQVAQLEDGAANLAGTSTALAKSDGVQVKQYSEDLQLAKQIILPHMFERIKHENLLQAAWMKAEMLPLLGHVDKLKPIQEAIEGRLLSVELYAGLVEEVDLVREGAPAPMDTPVHLLQRRHYMDEECLANYEAGGMDYRNVRDFDKWLARDENFHRILPFPRCVVAFRVRRYDKVRHASVPSDYIRFEQEKEEDRRTYLYIRNGDRLYWLCTKHDFGAQLFPDFDAQDTSSTQLHFKRDGDKYHIISDERLQGMREDEAAAEKQDRAQFKKERDEALAKGEEWRYGKTWKDGGKYGQWGVDRQSEDYRPLNTDNVYYDDVLEHMAKEVRAHNRMATVLQGLIDRSDVFHPHPRWQLWEPDGFAKAIKLVYDDSRALVAGDRPDFEAYRAKLNASIGKGSYCTGQYEPWLERERMKEYERRRSNWRLTYEQREVGHWWRPHYPGPDVVHQVSQCGKRGVTFKWTKERSTRQDWRSRGEELTVTFTCETKHVLNVSAYTPGDYKIFYADPRTRADYLEWAPLLLAAEDWHAGKTPKDGRRR